MAIAFVQGATNSTASSTTNITATFSSNVTTGNRIIAGVGVNSGSPSITMSDSQNNTYTQLGIINNTGQGFSTAVYIATASATGSVGVKATLGTSTTGLGVTACEYSGLSTTQDGTTQTGSGAGTAAASSSLTTTNANDLIISFVQATSAGTFTAGSGFIMRENDTFFGTGFQDDIVTTTTTTTGPMTVTNSQWNAITLALQAGAGGGSSGITFVQGKASGSTSAVSSFTTTPTSNVTSGNVILVGVGVFSGAPTITMSDNQLNSYTQLGVINSTSQGFSAYVYVTTASATGSLNVKASLATAAPLEVTVNEYSGCSTAQDGMTQTGSGFGTSASSSTLNTTNANDLIISWVVTGSSGTYTAGSGYLLRENDTGFATGWEDLIVTSTQSATGPMTVPNSQWLAVVLALKASSGSGGGGGPITFIQANKNGTTTTVASLTAAFSSAQTAGNTNFVGVQAIGGTVPTVTVTDTAGNMYTQLGTASVSGQALWSFLFYCNNIVAASANTVKAAVSVSQQVALCIAEFSNVSNTQDSTTATGTGFGTALTHSSLTTTNATDVVLAFGTNIGTTALTVGTLYTIASNTATQPICALEYQIVSSTGSFTGPFTGQNQWWADIGAAFKQKGAGATGTTAVNGLAGSNLVTGVLNVSFGPVNPGTISGTMGITGRVSASGTAAPGPGGGGQGPSSPEGAHEGVGFWGGGSAPYG